MWLQDLLRQSDPNRRIELAYQFKEAEAVIEAYPDWINVPLQSRCLVIPNDSTLRYVSRSPKKWFDDVHNLVIRDIQTVDLRVIAALFPNVSRLVLRNLTVAAPSVFAFQEFKRLQTLILHSMAYPSHMEAIYPKCKKLTKLRLLKLTQVYHATIQSPFLENIILSDGALTTINHFTLRCERVKSVRYVCEQPTDVAFHRFVHMPELRQLTIRGPSNGKSRVDFGRSTQPWTEKRTPIAVHLVHVQVACVEDLAQFRRFYAERNLKCEINIK